MMMYLAHSLAQWWCISINTNGRGVRVKSHGQFQSLMTPISMLFSTASYYRKQMNLVQDHPNQWTKAQLHVPSANFALISRFLAAETTASTCWRSSGGFFFYGSWVIDRVKLKVRLRHESDIRAMYSDLSRQCKTCGTRFVSRDKQSDRMDWHVRKNREAGKYYTATISNS